MLSPVSTSFHPKQPLPRFGNATAIKIGSQTAGNAIKASSSLKWLDFQELGTATLKQIQLIYGLCILSRIAAASTRSKNEVRETTTRDSMGYAFWFFATPMMQRGVLAMAPAKYRSGLIQQRPAPESGALRKLNHTLNPLSRWSIPSSQQVKDRMHQALQTLEKQGYGPETDAYLQLQKHFQGMVKWRNLATGFGMAATVGLLGIGINLYNIHMTRKKVAQGQVGL